MPSVKNGIQIVSYHEGLAAGVAKMWNLSRDSWGGDTRVMTEEQVKTKEANSENIELYLALDENEVVGYCGLSEYKEDTGSLYIPLLNVLPSHHGKKIGKMLVMKALEKTLELGWPRLDLYTWPGNTKAVPLYKKCGFFWEDRDDTTHLMNFIPKVLNTPLLQPLFEKMDWYEASTRQIEVKPDGENKNGFSFYEYSWSSPEANVRVQFERTSRGITLIETDDFLVQLSMDNHEVIEELEHTYQLTIVNKTDSPMSFQATGTKNARVEYQLHTGQLTVEKEVTLSNTFKVRKGEEPSVWRTHPSIQVTVEINGVPCDLNIGISPIQPAKLEAFNEGNFSFLNTKSEFYLELKNNLSVETEFVLTIPENDLVSLQHTSYEVTVPAKGRITLPLPIIVRKHGFYDPIIHVQTKTSNHILTFEQQISVAFKGAGKKFGGESKLYWHVYNGQSQLNIRKLDLNVQLKKDARRKQPSFAFLAPKLGKPYTNEFNKKKPTSVTWDTDDSSIIIKFVLQSSDFPGIYLTECLQLFGDGIVHQWVEIENAHPTTYQNIAISQPIYQELGNTYFPLDQRVVFFSEDRPLEFGDLNPAMITGHWYFSKTEGETVGVTWPKNSKAAPEGWQFVIEQKVGEMKPGAKASTEKIIVALDSFQEANHFQAFAEKSHFVDAIDITSELDLKANEMIITPSSSPSFTLKTYRNSYLDGTLEITCDQTPVGKWSIQAKEEKNSITYEQQLSVDTPISHISAYFQQPGIQTKFEGLLLSPSGAISSKTEADGSIVVENGCLLIKANADFYPGLYSLKVNGLEWLDTEYPERIAKSWWNPWAGGMKWSPEGITTFSLLKEKTTVSTANIRDRKGNTWRGIAIQTNFEEHLQWKNVEYIHYYLMLPNVPVLATFLQVIHDGGKWLTGERWLTDLFLGGEVLTNLSIKDGCTEYRVGKQELPMYLPQDSYIESATKKERLYVISSLNTEETEAYINKEAFHLVAAQPGFANKKDKATAPLFFLFDERKLPAEAVQKLLNIQF
ncbi:GNAT family N-acetyltransferase [Robertmurraya korlensis]|uniref:GNAT family N-acetyltransferase n=1 Tax=Robertmurraya korlensis TaxID=519977 RepID=UPI0008258A79|nr:GNAT family N-acetyltransferase [Robertmurraya korlensis]